MALGAVACLCLVFSLAVAADALRPVCSYTLSSTIKAMAGDEGALEIVSSDLALPLLRGNLDKLTDSRRRRGGEPSLTSYVSLTREGIPGGQRGFSAQADDDGDGLVDEDQQDGLDNDGDGLVDEDFSAISDAMTAVHVEQGSGWAQLEFMHWAGTRLQNALFLNFSAAHELSGATVPYYRLESSGEEWREIDVFSRYHDPAGQSLTDRATAFVIQVTNPASMASQLAPSALSQDNTSASTWVGVLVLNSPSGRTGREYLRPKLEGGLLSLPLTEQATAAVICTASSWMQLNRLLLDAAMVYEGVRDPVSKVQARWIVSPLCSRCRLEKSMDFTVLSGSDGALSLRFVLQPGRSGLLDPDLFKLEGYPLGAPSRIIWKPTAGKSVATPWAAATFDDSLDLPKLPTDLYGLLGEVPDHTADGVLFFDFVNPAAGVLHILKADSEVELQGVWLDGRTFALEGAVNHPSLAVPASSIDGLKSPQLTEPTHTHDGQLSLSPNLLEGWPNPFRDQIRIEFVIPSSVSELFDWPEGEAPPQGVEFSGPVVWSGGQPSVSVKVYSINGQELISLQQGSLGEGRYSVSWNGTDAAGRHVASGTYFCKLQLDDWSVTRRLVFIR